MVVLIALFHGEADQVVREDRVGIVVASNGIWRPLQRTSGGVFEGVNAACVEIEVIGVRAALIEVRLRTGRRNQIRIQARLRGLA